MVLVVEGGVLPVLDGLEVPVQLQLGVEQAVLLDVLLVLDLAGVGELGQGLLVLLLELGHRLLVLGLGDDLLLLTALSHGGVVLAKVAVQIALRVGDELGDLVLVLGLHRLGLASTALACSSSFWYWARLAAFSSWV